MLAPSVRSQQPRIVYVSPQGRTGNPGTQAQPFLTLEEARDAIRKAGPSNTTVLIDGGTYLEPQGLILGPQDSGTPGHPVIYRAIEGRTPRLIGAVKLDPNTLVKVTDSQTLARITPAARGHIYAVRLSSSVKTTAYPDIFHGNGGLFNVLFDDRILPLSRWPETGYTTIKTVTDSGIAPPAGGTFIYRDEVADHMQRWQTAANQGELWLTGFWRVPFEVETVRVARIDASQHQVTLAAPVPQGIGSKYTPLINGTRHGEGKEQYYASNLLEEINRPGQWSYDFKSRILYLWPPTMDDLAAHELLLASTSSSVITIRGAHDVQLTGLTVEGGIANGITLSGTSHTLIAGSTLRNIGMGGIDVEGGSDIRVQSNTLEHLGSYGIHLIAGDRKSLTPGNAIADNNHIAYIGEQDRITDGIFLDGVGNQATHNLVHDAPYNGIRYQGNDQHMAYNEIHHIGLDAGDLGIFYTNGDWAAQGDQVDHNFGHDAPNANGSYLDDGSTGRTSTNNVFYKIASGIFLGGGHDNHVSQNLIVDCRIGIHVDNRGESRKYDQTAGHLTSFLRTIDPNKAPWSVRYPHFLDDVLPNPTEPLGNTIQSNLIVGAKIPYQVNAPAIVSTDSNPSISQDGITFDPKALIFRSSQPGFAEVSVAKAGLYQDAYRKRLPSDEETGRFVDRSGTITFDSNVDIKASNKNTKP